MDHNRALSMCPLLPDDGNELKGITHRSVWIGPMWSLVTANLQDIVILPFSDADISIISIGENKFIVYSTTVFTPLEIPHILQRYSLELKWTCDYMSWIYRK